MINHPVTECKLFLSYVSYRMRFFLLNSVIVKDMDTTENGMMIKPSEIWLEFHKLIEAVVQRCSVKEAFLKIWINSQENTCARVSFLIKLQASVLIFCDNNDCKIHQGCLRGAL